MVFDKGIKIGDSFLQMNKFCNGCKIKRNDPGFETARE
jgi:hypothetical protein